MEEKDCNTCAELGNSFEERREHCYRCFDLENKMYMYWKPSEEYTQQRIIDRGW